MPDCCLANVCCTWSPNHFCLLPSLRVLRSAIACAHHAPSYAHLMLGSRQQGEGNAETAEDSNAESSRGAADGTQHRDRSQEEATDSGLDAGSSDEGHMQQGRVAAAEQLLSCCLHAVRGAADKHVSA